MRLEWSAPKMNADSSLLRDLAGFRVYRGKFSGDYTDAADVGRRTRHQVRLATGVWFFAVTAYDRSGNESDYSTEVAVRVGDPSGT